MECSLNVIVNEEKAMLIESGVLLTFTKYNNVTNVEQDRGLTLKANM